MASGTASAQSPREQKQKSPFKTRADYLAWLEAERKIRGEGWYKAKIEEMNARDTVARKDREQRREDMKKAREASRRLWWQQIDAWSVAGGFEAVLAKLPLPARENEGKNRQRFRVNGVIFEIDMRKQACTRWDGHLFRNGKRGSRGALGVAKCFFELQGSADPTSDANEFVASVSGIVPDEVELTPDIEKRLAKMRADSEAAAKQRAEEERREDPMSAEDIEEAPRRIVDETAIAELTVLMAKERNFSIDFAKRLVATGVIWFGVYKWRDKDTNKVVDTGRAIACSDVRGFATGTIVGHSSREFRQFYTGEHKGKNLGKITKGAVILGNWGESTKKVTLVEGVYTGAALMLLRERRNRPLADDEAILVMAGSRFPERLLEMCKQRGIRITLAYDNDIAGRTMAAPILEWCKERGVQCERALPTRGEMAVCVSDDEWGREAYARFTGLLSEKDIRFQFLAPEGGTNRVVVETTDESCDLYSELARAEEESRPPKGESRLSVKFHRKDWNELIQHEYTPRALTTVGLPKADPTLEEQMDDYFRRIGASEKESVALRESLLVYPAIVDGEPHAVWSGVDPTTGAVRGFRAESLRRPDTQVKACGASWLVGFSLGRPEASDTMAVADSPEQALKAWRDGGKGMFAVLPLEGLKIPSTAVQLAEARNLFVTPAFGNGEKSLENSAKLAIWAKTHGLSYRAPAKRGPALTPAIG